MQESDTKVLSAGDVLTSLALLTRLPVKADFARGAQAAWAYPLAGAVLAMCAGGLSWAAMVIGLPVQLAALLWVASVAIISGAMHEDGLADCADGFWGAWEPARRLEIMKDSQIGSYGVIALCLSLAARWMAVSLVMRTDNWFWALCAVAMLSRAVMPALMRHLPHARMTGLSHAQGRPKPETTLVAVVIGAGAAIIFTGWMAGPMIAVAAILTVCVGWLAHRKIGGQTGDVLGAAQQICEIGLLLVLCAS